jgi:cytochrome P450
MSMAEIAELDLPHLAMEQDWFAADPAPQFAAARARHPWLATSIYGYVVTSFPAMRELVAMEAKVLRTAYDEMVESMGALDTPWGTFQQHHILAANGADHERLRRVLAPAFTPRQANRHRPLMRAVISQLLDEWAPKGAFDFEEFASWFPITVMCRMIGASPEIIPSMRSSLEALGLSVSMDMRALAAMQDATVLMEDVCTKLVAERDAVHQTGDDKDLLDLLINVRREGGISQEELISLLIFLFIAGYDTSKNIMTMMMHELIAHPEIYQRCAEDAGFCANVVEETFRLRGVSSTSRAVTRDFDYRDVHIPEGTILMFPWGILGQDPAIAEDAHLFRPEREERRTHAAFAMGGHMCLGHFIARAQIAEGLHQIARRITRPTTSGPRGWRVFTGVWGISGLPIEFEPA